MIKRNGTSLSLVQKVRGVGLFDSFTHIAAPYYWYHLKITFEFKMSTVVAFTVPFRVQTRQTIIVVLSFTFCSRIVMHLDHLFGTPIKSVKMSVASFGIF